MWESKWDRNPFLERLDVNHLGICPPVILAAAVALEMTSSCNKLLISYEERFTVLSFTSELPTFSEEGLAEEKQKLPSVSKEDWISPSPTALLSPFKFTVAISRSSQWKNSDMVLVTWMCIYY